MSKWKPGQPSANPNGRPKGSENVASGKVRELWRNLLVENIEILRKDFLELDGKDRLNIAVKISNFILPRLQSIEVSNYPDWSELLIMTPEERIKEIIRLKMEIESDENRK